MCERKTYHSLLSKVSVQCGLFIWPCFSSSKQYNTLIITLLHIHEQKDS